MDFDKLATELDKLNLFQLENEDLNDPETWLFTPTPDSPKTKENESLDKWLKGAVDKVDFRTRSALSRRLEKKKRKVDKEKRRNNMESSLSMIEEVSSESGPLSDREQRYSRRPREKENMSARKAISEASIDSNDDYEDEEEEEEYFDAPSTPKKLPFGRNLTQQSPRKIRVVNTVPKSSKDTKKVKLENVKEETPTEWKNLGDIERRAKEQERELQLELMKSQRDWQKTVKKTSNASFTISRSRHDSTSSSASSVISGQYNKNNPSQSCTISTSKSVDFRNNLSSVKNCDQISLGSSRSNEGSLADLSSFSASEQINQALMNSRLPLPRRPTIPGKTGIPHPTPKRILQKIDPPEKMRNTSSPPATPMNDDECF
ncbi:hypothetical protein Mgra_00001718 [Meloidogyne graminicola]|uniref:Uncharacterized protein n=1 Tax=Meloidogyne graminicola TaxID=189291 RepID=A0A8T0A073_9BILA|nr:hypothetical protein Mgra_00001718 [Meloidogyne graminicola]